MVTAADWMIFGRHPLAAHSDNPLFRLVQRGRALAQARHRRGPWMRFAISPTVANEPSADLEPEITRSINYRGRRRIGLLAKALGVKRYVLASSASVYGPGAGKEFSETSPLNPVSMHAQCNKLIEDALFALNDDEFSVTSLRSGTMFGLARRMRFDVVLNSMTLNAFKAKKITIQRRREAAASAHPCAGRGARFRRRHRSAGRKRAAARRSISCSEISASEEVAQRVQKHPALPGRHRA